MSKLINDCLSIYDAMQYIESGKYVMPVFQKTICMEYGADRKALGFYFIGLPNCNIFIFGT